TSDTERPGKLAPAGPFALLPAHPASTGWCAGQSVDFTRGGALGIRRVDAATGLLHHVQGRLVVDALLGDFQTCFAVHHSVLGDALGREVFPGGRRDALFSGLDDVQRAVKLGEPELTRLLAKARGELVL